jgi:RND family efflux transporter MFP subunit
MKTLLIAVLSCLLLASCSGNSETTAAAAKGGAPAGPRGGGGAGGGRGSAAAPRKVETIPVMEKSLDEVAQVTGTLAAEQDIVLGMKVAGRIAEITVDLGSPVRKGEPIARIDPTDFELRVRQSEAALQQALVRLGLPPDSKQTEVDPEALAVVKQAKAELGGAKARSDRAMMLDDKGLIAKSDLDATMSAYRVAEAKYEDAKDEARNRQGVLAQRRSETELARQQLADTILYAPIDGVVRLRTGNVGQYVAVGAPVLTIVQMNPLRLRAAVPERHARSVRVGQSVRVMVEGIPGQYQGRVERMSPAVDETNRTLMIEAAVSNPNNVLRPGGFARSEIVLSTGKKTMIVPTSTLATFAGIDRVFIVKDGKAAEKRVKLGRRIEDGVEVLEGIAVGDRVVIQPGDLNDGDPVVAGGATE